MSSTRVVVWVVAACILYTLSTTALVLRILAVRVRKLNPKLPEYLVLLAWICQTGYIIDVSYAGMTLGGYGIHIGDLTLDQITISLKAFWISEWFWAPGVMAFRLAILLLYMDIFRTNVFRYQAIGTAAVIVGYFVACILTICLLCRPVAYNWDLTLEGTCGNEIAIEYFSAAFNMALDIWVVYLPLPTIWQLQLSPQKKWILTAAFSLGLGTAAVNLGRLIQTLQCGTSTDPTYCFLDSSILVSAEFSGGILVACVPTLGPLFAGHKNTESAAAPRRRGESEGALRTFGSTPLRGLRGSKASKQHTFDDDLFSRIDPENSAEAVEESTAALAMQAAHMGHQAEIVRSQSHDDSVEEHQYSGPVKPGGIVRTIAYNVN